MPPPSFVSAPVPLITPLKVRSLLRLNSTRLLLAIDALVTEPVVPPLPIDSVPALTVVSPV